MAFDLDDIHQHIRKLRKHLKRWPKHATPKQVHSLRTTARRFETAMQALALDSNKNERRLLRKMAQLRSRAGKVRDLDVLTGFVAALKMGAEEEECRVQLLEHLGAEHADRNERLHSFAVRHRKSLRRRLKRTATHLQTWSLDGITGPTAPGYTMLSELRWQQDLTRPLRLTRKNLHPYRLRVKKLRDMLQMEKDPTDREFIETLGRVKDAIGEWHDWQQLLKIASENLHHATKCQFISEFQKITQQKFKHATAIANAGRNQIQSSLSEPATTT
ncbi:MAG: CHAD domain-containing protein [Acidobacteriota bacterium]